MLLNYDNYDEVCQLPCNNDAKELAVRIRFEDGINTLMSGKMLIKRNIKKKIDVENINSTVNHVWNHYLKSTQREEFENLANKVNEINRNIAYVDSESRNNEIDKPFGVALFLEQYFESLILTTFS